MLLLLILHQLHLVTTLVDIAALWKVLVMTRQVKPAGIGRET